MKTAFEERSLSSFNNQIKRISITQKLVPANNNPSSLFDDKLYANNYISIPPK